MYDMLTYVDRYNIIPLHIDYYLSSMITRTCTNNIIILKIRLYRCIIVCEKQYLAVEAVRGDDYCAMIDDMHGAVLPICIHVYYYIYTYVAWILLYSRKNGFVTPGAGGFFFFGSKDVTRRRNFGLARVIDYINEGRVLYPHVSKFNRDAIPTRVYNRALKGVVFLATFYLLSRRAYIAVKMFSDQLAIKCLPVKKCCTAVVAAHAHWDETNVWPVAKVPFLKSTRSYSCRLRIIFH